MRHALFAVICLLLLGAGVATAVVSTSPGEGAGAVSVDSAGGEASPAVRTLRRQIRATRSLAVGTAYVAALPARRHGHAERVATTVPQLVPILARWQQRLGHYRAALARRRPVLAGLRCIHRSEGAWNAVSDSAPTYHGGLQMDRPFERAYGSDVLAAHDGADADGWSRHDQLMVAMRAYRHRGYGPWPTTAAACGLA